MLAPSWPLRTARLTLRLLEPDDFEAFAVIHRDAEVARYLYNEPRHGKELRDFFDRKRANTALHAEDDWMGCAVVEEATGTMVGDFAFHWVSAEHRTGEIGYLITPGAQGKGYATEAAGALLNWAFAAGFHRIIGRLDARNAASARVLEKLGMRREALHVENEWVKGEWASELVYAVLAREWTRQ